MKQDTIPVAHATAVVPMAPPSSSERKKARPSLKDANYGRSSRVLMPKQQSKKLDNSQIRSLQEQGYSRGLAEAMTLNNAMFPLRIWIVDNSGSMISKDGNRIVETRNRGLKMVQCTRYTEISETVAYHAQMAGLLQVPTVFRLLNDPGSVNCQQQFSVAERGEEFIEEDIQLAMKSMRSSPLGLTPLTSHVREIRKNIVEMAPTLRSNGSRVVVVIATDGLPTSGSARSDRQAKNEFTQALRSLEGLPVWVVIRLCTDDEEVVEYYNELDDQLELSMDVLDDLTAEAVEVYEHNKFLNYTLPLHRCREMGFHHRLFDILDNRKLSIDELQEFFVLLFGEKEFDGVPDAQVDWKGFMAGVTRIVEKEPYQWNPITKKVQPWINLKKLNRSYRGHARGGGAACSIM